MKGISADCNCAAYAACIKKAGFDFIFRYYASHTGIDGKVLTPTEAHALSAAGLRLAVVYETSPKLPEYFTDAQGEVDGKYAYEYATKLKQPGNTAIYFTVDYDPDDKKGEISKNIAAYFTGVQHAFIAAGNNQPIYAIGVYGSGLVCGWLKNNLPFIKYSWLAESPDWQGSKSYTGWDVKQYIATAHFCSLTPDDYEGCEANGDFGQFVL